jgi:hypothetical protein
MATFAPQSLRIGITIGLHHENESLWSNGIKQNAVYLAEALKHCPSVQSVCLVNTTAVPITSALPWDLERCPTKTFEDAKDHVDVLIELGGQIDAMQTDYLKRRGARVVSYCCGFEYVHAMQSILFDRQMWGSNLFINQRYDAIWMIPQVENISKDYFTTFRRRPAQVAPFVWDPMFVRQRSSDQPHHGEYRPRAADQAKRISIMEPNHDVVKFCLYPILIVEETFREMPDAIEFLHVTNSERLANNSKEFVSLMLQLDIVQNNKAAFVGRFDTPLFLAEMTDIVVSHQWENALNYFYFDVAWQGYPLVHNAHLCPDLGYYYNANDVTDGKNQLINVLKSHDQNWQDYLERQRAVIARYLPGHADVTAGYERLLFELMQQEPI